VTGSLETQDPPESDGDSTFGWFWLALMFVMFTFGGWNDIAFVASEVREPRENLLPSLVVGTLIVLSIYLLVNFALVYGMGFDRMAGLGQQWQSATSALIGDNMGVVGNRLFAGLVCVSCLGAINAMVFTSPRIYWATAADYPALRWVSGSNEGGGGWRAMLLQAIVTLVFIGMFGAKADGFDNIVAATAPYFWIFLALTVISLVVCRIRFKGKFDGYRVPFGPLLPFVFVAACGFMTYRGFLFMFEENERIQPAILIGVWVLLGVMLSFVLKSRSPSEA
jgi:amino acid transporter